MSGETNLMKLLSSIKPSLSDERYVFISSTVKQNDLASIEPWALISEDEGTTLIIDKGKADSNNLSYQGVFKRITLTVHSSLEAVGLTAAVSTKLAEHGISANVMEVTLDIFTAIKQNDLAIVREQIESRSNLNIKDHNGMTPLMVAVDFESFPMVQAILKAKASVDEVDKYGQTALMLAAGRGNIQIVRLLLASHANTKLVSKSRAMAIDFAEENGHKDIAALLRK
jgi:uncharacterized protein